MTNARQLWFGPEERPLFAWFHPAATPVRDAVVVMCAPFGHELMVSYRACRMLGERLAVAGFSVLRFDYDGTGDSAGDADEAGRVAAWQASVAHAAHEARRLSGASRVIYIGTRLGALLAAASAAQDPHAAALVLLAPVVSGRAYARELMALRAMNPGTTSDEEVVGYAFTQETRAALGALDLSRLRFTNDAPMLVIARDDGMGGESAFVDQRKAAGASIELSTTPGYAAMMTDDAFTSVVPESIIREITAWLALRITGTAVAEMLSTASYRAVATLASGAATIGESLVSIAGMPTIISEPLAPDRI